VGTSWDCGFNEDGGYGISFLFFVLAFGLNGTSAAALLVLPNSLFVSSSHRQRFRYVRFLMLDCLLPEAHERPSRHTVQDQRRLSRRSGVPCQGHARTWVRCAGTARGLTRTHRCP